MTQTNQKARPPLPGDKKETSIGTTRRHLLFAAGSLAASSTVASWTPVPVNARELPAPSKQLAGVSRVRSVAARSVRVSAAVGQFQTPTMRTIGNDDESRLSQFIGSFTKTLPHNNVGEVEPVAYRALTGALLGRKNANWDNIILAPQARRKLANPQASLSFGLAGGDSHAFFMPPAPTFSSAETAAEMAEIYWHALLRDVPFDDYPRAPAAAQAVSSLNTLVAFSGPRVGGKVTPGTLFRGSFSGDLLGNYVSQFLLKPIPQGAALIDQRYQTTVPGDDHMTNRDDWLHILRGGAPASVNRYEDVPRYITSGRDLCEYVHRDYTYQTYLQAALILLGMNAPRQPSNPYNDNPTEGGFVTFGAADLLSQLGEVTSQALKAAWYHKWQQHRRLRPEVFGGRVHFTLTGECNYPIHADLLNSDVIQEIARSNNGEFWLPMAYPEGSPTHPAYPAGHAVVAGACVTVLKAFFDPAGHVAQPLQVVANSNGAAVQPYDGPDTLTVGGELNKLANNIAIGRNLAGVHWRSDGTDGLLLGEEVAIRMLRDARRTYREVTSPIDLTGFSGTTITI
ncbi:MAG: vanadium-dependent haloperoxidase [Lysobacterales bacterium]